MSKLSNYKDHENVKKFWCPGCKEYHLVATGKNDINFPIWGWNGDSEKPTITPSIKVEGYVKDKKTVCHSFITNGKIQYLNDCTHALAGKTIDMEECDGKED